MPRSAGRPARICVAHDIRCQSDAVSTGIFSRRTNRTHYVRVHLLFIYERAFRREGNRGRSGLQGTWPHGWAAGRTSIRASLRDVVGLLPAGRRCTTF
eukprot:9310893-Pyramimonas_sp.AAC.2